MKESSISMTDNRHKFSNRNKILRILWIIFSFFFFKPFAPRIFRQWRTLVLKIFGGKIDWSSTIHANVKIWAPWNLEMRAYSCLGPKVDCYNQGKITILEDAVISQKTYLCASSHNFEVSSNPLYMAPIQIGKRAWIAADAFIGPGVSIGAGAVVGARSAVFKDVEPWTVVGGNPAQFIKKRVLKE